MFPSPSSRDQLQELFCAAVEQQVFGPEPQRCFGFGEVLGVCPRLRAQVLVILHKVHQPMGLVLISVNL